MKTTPRPTNVPSTLSPTKKHRWWLYVLVTFGALLLLPVGAFVALVLCFTSREPAPIPKVLIAPADREAFIAAWTRFREDIAEGRPTSPMKVSPEELNCYFNMLPRLKDRIYVRGEGNRMRTEFSVPLDEYLPVIGGGRYLNGADTFNVRLGADGLPQVEILSGEFNGRRLPRWLLRQFERKEFYQDIYHVLDEPGLVGQLKSVEIRDGTLILTSVNSSSAARR